MVNGVVNKEVLRLGNLLCGYFRFKGNRFLVNIVDECSKTDHTYHDFVQHLKMVGIYISHKKRLSPPPKDSLELVFLKNKQAFFINGIRNGNSDFLNNNKKMRLYEGVMSSGEDSFESVVRSQDELERNYDDIFEIQFLRSMDSPFKSSKIEFSFISLVGLFFHSIAYIALILLFVLLSLKYFHFGIYPTKIWLFWLGIGLLFILFLLFSVSGKMVALYWSQKHTLYSIYSLLKRMIDHPTSRLNGVIFHYFKFNKAWNVDKNWTFFSSIILIIALYNIEIKYGILMSIVWVLTAVFYKIRTLYLKKCIPNIIASMMVSKESMQDIQSGSFYASMGSMMPLFLKRIEKQLQFKRMKRQDLFSFFASIIFVFIPISILLYMVFQEFHIHFLSLGGGISVVILSLIICINAMNFIFALPRKVYQQAMDALYGYKSSLTLKNNTLSYDKSKQNLFVSSHRENASPPSIVLHKVCVKEDGYSLLNDINCTIQAKSHVILLGSVGAGKSIFLKYLAGFVSSSSGMILFNNQVENFRWDLITYVNNQDSIPIALLKETLELYKESDLFKQWVDIFDLHAYMKSDSNWYTLPKAIVQLFNIVRGLLEHRPILLLDDPIRDMDSLMEAKFIQFMKKFAKDKTLVMSTQKESLLDLGDTLFILEKGEMILQGDKESVLKTLKQYQVEPEAVVNQNVEVIQEEFHTPAEVVSVHTISSLDDSSSLSTSSQTADVSVLKESL